MKVKIILFMLLLALNLSSCNNVSKNNKDNNDLQMTEPIITTTTSEITINEIDEIPININEYAYAPLPFMKENIKNNTIHTADDFPKVNVQTAYCKEPTELSGFEGYVGCNLVYNSVYDTLGDYKEYLFSDEIYTMTINQNTLQGKFFDINGGDLLKIIEESTNCIELPTAIYVAFRDVFDNSGYWIEFEKNGTDYMFEVFDTYFVLRVYNYDEPTTSFIKSYTYFESKEMIEYLKTLK